MILMSMRYWPTSGRANASGFFGKADLYKCTSCQLPEIAYLVVTNLSAMILENTLIKLDYNPAKDLLSMEWPDINYYSIPEFNHLLGKVIATIRHYDISCLLIDASHSPEVIKELEFMDIAIKFLEDLRTTRIKKVARLVNNNVLREHQIREMSSHTNSNMDFQTFVSLPVALSWLES